LRLGLYIDGAFRTAPDGAVYSGTELFGFMRFACAVGRRFDRFVLIARGTGDDTTTAERLPPGVELSPLPFYPSLRALGAVARAAPATLRSMWRALDGLDAVWVSGVHPLGLAMALIGLARRRRVVLLIRQDSPAYFRTRARGRAQRALLVPLDALDWAFRALGRRLPVTVVGPELAGAYRAPRPNVLEMHVTLLERDQLAPAPRDGGWGDRVELLTVGRIEPEKNPLLLADAIAELERSAPGRFSLTWVGEGRMAGALRERMAELGLADRLGLPGFVPFGEGLLERYRSADAFVHVALTEGVPGVLLEAMGSGLPVVATDVGGVRAALGEGASAAGLSVPPDRPEALAEAILRLDRDPGLRERLASAALERARSLTLESESARVARFVAGPVERAGA
jgi:glycosyltransferase involved in cell wall biosynthesis